MNRIIYPDEYFCISDLDVSKFRELTIVDELGGFDAKLRNSNLDILFQKNKDLKIKTQYVVDERLKLNYPNLIFDRNLQENINLSHFHDYKLHPKINHKNFLCSFNGSNHVSRKLLVLLLNKFNWFNTTTCSKNFIIENDMMQGYLFDYLDKDQERFYCKFFDLENLDFFDKIYSFEYTRFDHVANIYNLENILTNCFVNLVSESMATSYYPFITEKFTYSVVTRGLFIGGASPQWHEYLEKYYGFKMFRKIFDYRFDSIENPIIRFVELFSMLSKFSILSTSDWHDLYLLEQDTIEYNYDHYFSKGYIKHLETTSTC